MDKQIRRSSTRSAAAALLLAAGVTGAGPGLDAGVAALQQGQYERAVEILEDHAEQGDPGAAYLLGTLYRLGKGTERSEYRAFLWCRQAAEDGHLEAQFQLALMYLRGEGVTENDHTAIDWLWRASEGGHPQARQVLEYVLHEDFTYGC